MNSIATPELWIGFTLFVVFVLGLDLLIFHRRPHAVSMKESLLWVAIWVSLAGIFNIGLAWFYGRQVAMEFLTGYCIEEALSVDNLFVFLVIFSYFSVPKELQHRVLFWGILGAIVMRVFFIFAGVALLERFHFLVFVFGGFLIFTGIKLLLQKEQESDPSKNLVVRLGKKMLPLTDGYRGSHFFVRENGHLMATPLFLVLLTVEATDVVFAVDSIPAVLAITRDPFIVYTSNIFAILGLRALFFVLSGALNHLHYLQYGLGAVLTFVGIKMVIVKWVDIPIGVSLSVVAGLLGLSVAASLLIHKPETSKNDKDREIRSES